MSIVKNIKVETRDIKWVSDNFKSGQLIVDNSFQRRYVWLNKDRVSLIESILIGFPIPEVYVWQNKTDPDTGERIHSIVDGQQRLGAVFDFVTDGYALEKKFFPKEYNADYIGKKFTELTAEQKSTIWGYDFSIRFISSNVSLDDIKNLFLRLNRTNITLNPQELRNAEFNGEFIKLADDISKYEFWEKYKIFNAGDLRRMTDIQFISTILIFIRMGIAEETTQGALNKVYDQYNESYPQSQEDKELFLFLLDTISNLLNDQENTLEIAKKKTHFYSIFTLAYFLFKSGLDAENNYQHVAGKLNEWYGHYNNETTFNDDAKNILLNEYRVLSQEGVQKKTNRQRRMEILKEVVLS